MKISRALKALVVAGLLSTVLVTGCETGSGKMTVGKVDTATLLQDDPDYQSMSITYSREQIDIKKDFVERLKAVQGNEDKVKKLQQEYMKVQQEFEDKWKTKTNEFLATRHSSIQSTAESIAKRKKIDIVLIDSKMYPTVEWGGVDMTKDMALAMSQGSQAPKSTATPAGDK